MSLIIHILQIFSVAIKALSKPFLSAEPHGEAGAALSNPGVDLLRMVIDCHCCHNQKLRVNKSGFF